MRFNYRELGAPGGYRRRKGLRMTGVYELRDRYERYTSKALEGFSLVSDRGMVRLTPDGRLSIEPGYQWDGPSGLTFDDRWNLEESLTHDALYELAHEGSYVALSEPMKGSFIYSTEPTRKAVDDLFFEGLKARIPSAYPWLRRRWLHIRAAYYHRAVRWFGKAAWCGES